MKLIVTGAGGQLGSEWVRFLEERKVEILSFTSSGLDITNQEAVRSVLDANLPDVVINCAAWTDVDGAEKDPAGAMEVNRDGVRHLAGWCVERNRPIIHYSTDYVFGGSRRDLVRYPDGYPEDAAPSPVNEYGRSKLAGEEELKRSGADFLLLRISWLCGEFGDNFVKKMLRLGAEKSSIRVVRDQLGSPSFADRVVELSWRLLEREKRGVFHLASRGLVSWFDLAEEIFRQSGTRVQVEPVPSRSFTVPAPRPAFSKLDTRLASHVLGEEMESWQEGLHRLMARLNRQDRPL